jgi:serine/threonine protein kinase
MPTVAERLAHCQAREARYSIDPTALRRRFARRGCANFPCYHERRLPLEESSLHTDPSGAAPPDAFGRFRVLHKIGAGTLGPVFRAHDPVSDRAVAIKQFTLDMSPERLQQFAAELQHLVTAHLAHPGIAAPLAVGVHGASAYLVQELVTADSLDLVIREYGAAPPNDALRVAAQLAGALDFANAAQVRHGALHPRDVLLSSDETRVTGLGVAHALERVGIGAPVRRPYTPPERIAAGEWDRRSDVFSLAALAHELLWARRIAGTGSSVAAGLTPITGGDLNVLHAVFSRALAEDPAERFETALQFADALRSAFPDTEVKDQAAVLKQIEDDFAEGSTMFPQAQPVPAAAPPETRRPVVVSSEPAQTPASTQPPLVDRKREIDLPLAEIARAEQERYRDVESAPALMPPAGQRAADAPDAASAGRYLDYVRNDQAVAAAPQAPAPIVVRPVLPEPTVTRETPRSNRVPVLLALAIGLMLGFGAGYGFGLRQRPAPAVASETADGTPAPGREFTESAVPDATRPAATPADAPPPAAGTDSRAAAPAAEPPAAPPPPAAAAAPPVAPPAATPAPAPAPTRAPAAPAAAPRPAAPVAPPADGRILVRTTPAGARVFVDEREYGVTPFAVRNLARGGHRVRVMRDGYNTEDRRIVLTASQPSQSVTIALERQSAGASSASQARPAETGSSGRFAGDLVVDSRPPGATVFIDGKAVGTTPVTVRGVAAGSHAIRVEHEGYRRWSSAVRVVASQANRITAALER